jgi:hypothetical protein
MDMHVGFRPAAFPFRCTLAEGGVMRIRLFRLASRICIGRGAAADYNSGHNP